MEESVFIVSAYLLSHSHQEARPSSRITLDRYIPSIESYDTLYDRESDTSSGDLAAAIRTIKSLKYSFLLFICHADSCICNSEFFPFESDRYCSSVIIVADGIGDEIGEEESEVFLLYGYPCVLRDMYVYCYMLLIQLFMMHEEYLVDILMEIETWRLCWCLQIREFYETIERVSHGLYSGYTLCDDGWIDLLTISEELEIA